jgi:hypothetical protein
VTKKSTPNSGCRNDDEFKVIGLLIRLPIWYQMRDSLITTAMMSKNAEQRRLVLKNRLGEE